MDFSDFTIEYLYQFFRSKKTQMSSMEKPEMFLNHLRDHDLVEENFCKEVIQRRSKMEKMEGVYQILDNLKGQPQCIKTFWSCVFKKHMLQQYPTLQELYTELKSKKFPFIKKDQQMDIRKQQILPSPAGKLGVLTNEKIGRGLDMASLIKWNNYNQTEEHEKGDELPGSSSQAICSQQQNAPESSYMVPVEKGQQKVIRKRFKDQTEILVTCGTKRGMLNKEKLSKGEMCIMVGNTWYHPTVFEEFGGKGNSKNWKSSIRYRGKPLLELFKKHLLIAPRQKRRPKIERTSSSGQSLPSFSSSSEGHGPSTGGFVRSRSLCVNYHMSVDASLSCSSDWSMGPEGSSAVPPQPNPQFPGARRVNPVPAAFPGSHAGLPRFSAALTTQPPAQTSTSHGGERRFARVFRGQRSTTTSHRPVDCSRPVPNDRTTNFRPLQ
ncbi:uncharacterized protein LOC114793378 [Denticeps clupeoides]|uniref:uncharacterized protein LOC114793378 n=1 Tax=Denticeps clupeoides TaxID=299321 RepID=UPI0010A48794|nr:uncharacterized protein LOC114793378 [Denticeps clupeoides]